MWRSTAKRRRLCEGGSERRRAQRRPFWTLVADVAKLDGLTSSCYNPVPRDSLQKWHGGMVA